MTFDKIIVDKVVEQLINGNDYREEVIHSINAVFFDFTIDFFKKIIDAKMSSKNINLDWYKSKFINTLELSPHEIANFAGINKKTIHNIAGNSTKETVIDFANANFTYLENMIRLLEQDALNEINITISLSYNNINVTLDITESLLVINALATKKISIRGGAWSAIGKRVEKPLVNRLCELTGVEAKYINNTPFIKDKKKDFDREVDYKLISKEDTEYRVEVKLMGKGNPESADVIHARNTNIFIADTLSDQNKKQFQASGVKFLELRGSNKKKIIKDFKAILDTLQIPYTL